MAKKYSKPKSKVLPESVERAVNRSTVNGGDSPFAVSSGGDINRRISDCAEARSLAVRLLHENEGRAAIWAQIRNQNEGGRPFDPAELRRNGEQGRTNCNFNDARAALKRAVLPFWKMVHEVPRKISVTVHATSPDADKWGLIFAECFDRFLDDWGDEYMAVFEGITYDMVMFGPSFPMFPDGKTPRYEWAQAEQILFPKRTKCSVNRWELVALRRDMTIDQLVEKVRDKDQEKISKKSGWNPDAIHDAIEQSAPESARTQLSDPVYWQDMVVNNDLVRSGVWAPIRVIDLWAKQRDGKIKHYVFTEDSLVADYLCETEDEASEFKHLFRPIYYDFGSNGLIHGIKGFGVMNHHYATAINRTKCKGLDAVSLSMGLTFQKTDDSPDEAPPMQQWSFINLLPKGLTQVQIFPQIQQAMGLMQELQKNQNENNYTYSDAGAQTEIASAQTKGQGDLIASISSEGQSAQASVYLSQMGQLFSEIFRRLCKGGSDKDAKKFRERCKELGMPDNVFEDKIEKTVKCGASPTMASPAMRARIGQQLMGMMSLPGMNQEAIIDFNVANLAGAEGVSNFRLPQGAASNPRSRREAMMENADLSDGIPLPVDPSDAHVEHADEHLKPLEAIVEQAKAGMQPQQVPGAPVNPAAQITPDHLMAIQVVLPHANQHIEFLANDETKAAQFKQLNARSKMVENIARGLMARLARTQRNGNGADPSVVNTALMQPRQ